MKVKEIAGKHTRGGELSGDLANYARLCLKSLAVRLKISWLVRGSGTGLDLRGPVKVTLTSPLSSSVCLTLLNFRSVGAIRAPPRKAQSWKKPRMLELWYPRRNPSHLHRGLATTEKDPFIPRSGILPSRCFQYLRLLSNAHSQHQLYDPMSKHELRTFCVFLSPKVNLPWGNQNKKTKKNTPSTPQSIYCHVCHRCTGQTGCSLGFPEKRIWQSVCHATSSWRQGEAWCKKNKINKEIKV